MSRAAALPYLELAARYLLEPGGSSASHATVAAAYLRAALRQVEPAGRPIVPPERDAFRAAVFRACVDQWQSRPKGPTLASAGGWLALTESGLWKKLDRLGLDWRAIREDARLRAVQTGRLRDTQSRQGTKSSPRMEAAPSGR